jgi:hypothetical protein
MIPRWLSENLLTVSARLQPLGIDYAFLGGCIVPLLLDDPDVVPIRPTNDVDVVIMLVGQSRMASIDSGLRDQGFAHAAYPGAPMCRWQLRGITVDIMPDREAEFMGLNTRWFSEALRSATPYQIPGGEVPVISAPTFIATKLVAFSDRGKRDYCHRDMEDVISIVDGRMSLESELAASSPELRAYVCAELERYLADPGFVDQLPGHLPGDPASQGRLPLILERLRMIANLALH